MGPVRVIKPHLRGTRDGTQSYRGPRGRRVPKRLMKGRVTAEKFRDPKRVRPVGGQLGEV